MSSSNDDNLVNSVYPDLNELEIKFIEQNVGKSINLHPDLPILEVRSNYVSDLVKILKKSNRFQDIKNFALSFLVEESFDDQDVVAITSQLLSSECNWCSASLRLIKNNQKITFNISGNGQVHCINIHNLLVHQSMFRSLLYAFSTDTSTKDRRIMYMTECTIGFHDFKSIASLLSVQNTISGLILMDLFIGDDGACALASALASKECSLKEISLYDNGITDEGTQKIFAALSTNSTLTSLEIHHNIVGTKASRALELCIRHNDTLQSLVLFKNNLADEGAIAIASALKDNKTLFSLNLPSNKITDDGMYPLATALSENTSIIHLKLSGNRITVKGAEALSAALAVNNTLTELDLQGNSLGDSGLLPLLHALKRNCSLRSIKLSSNECTDLSTEQILRTLEYNDTLADITYGAFSGQNSEKLLKTLSMNRVNSRFANRKVYSWLLRVWIYEEQQVR